MNTCQFCGHTSPDVQPTYGWVGGQGDTLRPECLNIVGCWRRWHTREEAELERKEEEYDGNEHIAEEHRTWG